ncbi:hypothetical protein [Rossellomorea aquimaris]|uniref:Lipoprotein n=1 Tax=Rossellomorea aquimaris TaxID=189382 RepID=A0A5D4UMM4_9BACI|nr:hypothetical protein [Rossellomorea aquimaris]TYS81784.1 hypothetical protein FZD05_02975 [Rossellomorea aquimaris]TYS88408.1 hypothetical protein FZC85_02975 [Rossellomorea aquimaris]
MKKRLLLMMILVTASLLMACSGEAKQTGSTKQEETGQESKKEDSGEDGSEEAKAEEPVDSVDLEEATSQDQSSSTEDPLSTYPSEKIEYARVWLQVIGNKGVGELNVRHISAGEQLNPYDDNSVDYPEDVIVLSGKIMADGIVTYSGNGDGTINVYDVPSHWPSSEQIEESMEDYTKGIVEGTEQVSVGKGEDDEVIGVIGKVITES